jgi:hypothetical protein
MSDPTDSTHLRRVAEKTSLKKVEETDTNVVEAVANEVGKFPFFYFGVNYALAPTDAQVSEVLACLLCIPIPAYHDFCC